MEKYHSVRIFCYMMLDLKEKAQLKTNYLLKINSTEIILEEDKLSVNLKINYYLSEKVIKSSLILCMGKYSIIWVKFPQKKLIKIIELI